MSAAENKAVFLSYASQDAEAAKRICDALRQAGVEVWFDQSELRGGDAWDTKIRKQIKECALFVPVISANTQARAEGYFRLEWKLAADRSHLIARDHPFLVPVVIDDTTNTSARVPEEFHAVQWTRLRQAYGGQARVRRADGEQAPDDAAIAAFCAQIAVLLGGSAGGPPAISEKAAVRLPPPQGKTRTAVRPLWVWLALAVMLMATASALFWWPGKKAETGMVADKSIAVLPFDNLSDDKDTAYFTEGVHEDVLTNLANIRELRVVSRTSVMEYRGRKENIRQIAQKLGVTYVLEGSVRREGKTVRVTGQLINARTDEHVWANKYDRDLTAVGVFAIQSSLAEEIAKALRAQLSPQEKKLIDQRPTDNLVAYDLYLKARTLPFQEQDELLRRAVELDPNFALAWASIARASGWVYFYHLDRTPARLEKARVAIDTAVRLAPDQPEIIDALGRYYYFCFRDYARALQQYDRVLRVQPNNAVVLHSIAAVHRRQGNWAKCLDYFRRSVQLDPANGSAVLNYGFALAGLRRYADARAEYQRWLAHAPDSLSGRIYLATLQFEENGSTVEGEKLFSSLEAGQAVDSRWRWALMTGDATVMVPADNTVDYDSEVRRDPLAPAILAAARGDADGARKALPDVAQLRDRLQREPENVAVWSLLGRTEALRGNRDEALSCLRKALDLCPESVDCPMSRHYQGQLAFVRAWTGDKDGAIAEYARLLRTPYGRQNIHVMRRSPQYSPLRGDPRFEALLNDPKNNAPQF